MSNLQKELYEIAVAATTQRANNIWKNQILPVIRDAASKSKFEACVVIDDYENTILTNELCNIILNNGLYMCYTEEPGEIKISWSNRDRDNV